jgi:hypothetical protein
MATLASNTVRMPSPTTVALKSRSLLMAVLSGAGESRGSSYSLSVGKATQMATLAPQRTFEVIALVRITGFPALKTLVRSSEEGSELIRTAVAEMTMAIAVVNETITILR